MKIIEKIIEKSKNYCRTLSGITYRLTSSLLPSATITPWRCPSTSLEETGDCDLIAALVCRVCFMGSFSSNNNKGEYLATMLILSPTSRLYPRVWSLKPKMVQKNQKSRNRGFIFGEKAKLFPKFRRAKHMAKMGMICCKALRPEFEKHYSFYSYFFRKFLKIL